MIRKAAKYVLMMAIGATPVLFTPVAAHAQFGYWQDRDHDRDGDRDDAWRNGNGGRAYQDGYQKGVYDRRHNRRGDPDDDDYRGGNKGQYKKGYWAGYNGGNRYYGNNGGYYPNNNGGYYGNNGGYYGNNGGYGSNPQQVGYQDGVNDGSKDRATGHSFRPTEQQAYKNADHFYNQAYGSRQSYKDAYRQGYTSGYQQGYNGGNGWRR
ncbi:MAG: hypothetical protein JOZ43_05705 [Acidobacteriales bacterium]|nr:hypothetical protein [Terriglobales bacterium]